MHRNRQLENQTRHRAAQRAAAVEARGPRGAAESAWDHARARIAKLPDLDREEAWNHLAEHLDQWAPQRRLRRAV